MAVVMAIGFVGLSIPTAQSADLVGLVGAANATTIDNTDMSHANADSIAAIVAGGSVFRNATDITVAGPVLDIYTTISPIATATKARGDTTTFTADNKAINFVNIQAPHVLVTGNDPELIYRC